MSDTYVECLVKAKQPVGMKVLKVFLMVLTVLLVLAAFFVGIAFILAVLCGLGAYIVGFLTDLEYEYLYVDKEITVDKIMAKSRRKRVDKFSVERMEILAPINSYHLDNYKNRTAKVKDYSIHEECKPDLRYAMYYEGGRKIILSPSEDLVKAIKNVAPRKVFLD